MTFAEVIGAVQLWIKVTKLSWYNTQSQYKLMFWCECVFLLHCVRHRGQRSSVNLWCHRTTISPQILMFNVYLPQDMQVIYVKQAGLRSSAGCNVNWEGKMTGGIFRGTVHGYVRIPVQDYKSLCVAIVICVTLVNTQTDRTPVSYTHLTLPTKRIV